MKKILMIAMMLLSGIALASAQKAKIEFETTTHNFGNIPESSPVVTYTFVYQNTGDAPLVVNQAVASCGCTVPQFTRTPVKPGEKGEIKVTFNGTGKTQEGHFKKTITVRTNGEVEMVRLYIEGDIVKDAAQ